MASIAREKAVQKIIMGISKISFNFTHRNLYEFVIMIVNSKIHYL